MAAQIYGNQSGTVGLINAATAQNSTSGTAILFTGIPTGVKRITVMFNGVSTTGANNILVQLGTSSGVETTGYYSVIGTITGTNTCGVSGITNAFTLTNNSGGTDTTSGTMTLTLVGSNIWTQTGVAAANTSRITYSSGNKTLGGTLDRVNITTTGGTDTFDAGSINILYE